jgi:hypothetical protein
MMPSVAAQLPQPRYDADALHPEVIDPRIADVEALARWLDYAFTLPGGFRYGLGGFIGLIPGVGDIVDALISLYIVGRAVQVGIPRVTIVRMVLNIGIESVGGSLPFIGAMFDTVFKANRRNYELLRSQLVRSREQSINDWLFVLITALVVAAGVFLPVFILFKLFQHL